MSVARAILIALTLSCCSLAFACSNLSEPELVNDHDAASASSIDSGGGSGDGVLACTTAPLGSLTLEFTYDNADDATGGRVEYQGSQPWSLTFPLTFPTVSRIGLRSVRSELRFGDPEAFSGPRAETAVLGSTASRYAAGDVSFYGFSIFIQEAWVDDGGNEDILFQWHNISDKDLGESSKSPNIFLGIKRDEFILRVTSDAALVSDTDSPTKEQVVLVQDLENSIGWHDFVFQIRWSFEDNGFGLIKVWHKLEAQVQYQKVLEKMGPNMHNDRLAGYLKWGIYKPSWHHGSTATPLRVLFHDEIRAGSTFATVEPGCVR